MQRNGEYHLFTNSKLKIGDKVFPLANGIQIDGEHYINNFDIYCGDEDFHILAITGWPSEPHTILEFYKENGIKYIQTDKGYSPAKVYFKHIKTRKM